MRTNYHEKKQNKIERFNELADKNSDKSEVLYHRASDMAKVIPFGQPILVGHHSEKRDRAFRGKIDSIQSQASIASDKSDYYATKAATMESNTAISSDDPDAIDKLKEKLAKLQADQEMMKGINKIVSSKKLSPEAKIAKLITDYKVSDDKAKVIATGEGFPSYKLTNNNGNMTRIKQRIKDLEQRFAREHKEEIFGNIKIVTNVEANRVQILFPNKPSEEIRKQLKNSGFNWSPEEMAWQRFISNGAEYAAKQIVQSINQEE